MYRMPLIWSRVAKVELDQGLIEPVRSLRWLRAPSNSEGTKSRTLEALAA